MEDPNKVTYFAETDARNQRVKFGIKAEDRTRHMYVIGKTGMGKSNLLESLAIQDIQNGNGLAFLDPHGKSADLLLEYIPKERINDVVYFAPFDMEYPVSFNVMEDVGAERRHLVSSGLMSAFKKIWVDAWSARMEYILGNIMLALLEYPGSTLIGVNRMLADKNFRTKVVENITDPSVRSFWVDEYAKYTEKFAAEAAPAIQNKVGQFVANPLVRNIIGQPKSTFDIRKIMDEKKILIINLSKGRVGESNANLLGSMLITKIYLAAMSRADLDEAGLKAVPNFYLYVDEFQSFANESFADILSEARKYKLNLTIAHQYIEQMSEEVRAAVFGNVGTMITFRVGAYDAEVLEKEFAPQFTATDIVSLQKYQMYLKLMIDGVSSQPFSATGLAPIARPETSYVREIIDASRKNFARPRYEVEDEIRRWHENTFSTGGEKKNDDKRGGASGGSNSTASHGGGSQSVGGSASRSQHSHDTKASLTPSRQGQGSFQHGAGSPSGEKHWDKHTERSDRSNDKSHDKSNDRDRNRDRSEERHSDKQNYSNRESAEDHRGPRPATTAPVAQQSHSHSQDSSRRDKENRDSKDKKENRENRETELRKAISLSYLKAEPEVKNDQKTPKPENVAALREALLTVMKETQAQTQKPLPQSEPVATAPVVGTPSAHHHEHKKHIPIPVQPQASSVSASAPETTSPKMNAQQSAIQQNTEAQPSSKQQQTNFENSTKKNIKSQQGPEEVPEEILKKILDVQE